MNIYEIIEKAINDAMQSGPSAESEEVPEFTPETLDSIFRKHKNAIDTSNPIDKLSEDEKNVLVYALMDYASYGDAPEMEEALFVLDEICPDAAKDLREDNYMLKYRIEHNEPCEIKAAD